MPTLKYLEYSFDCTTAIKGDDYIRLLDENGVLVASFEGIADFSVFTLVNGEYTAPTAPGDCHVAVIRDDGTIAKGGHRCSDISNHTHDDRYYTESEVDTKLAGKANSSHNHSASEITSGTLPVARGGTGNTSVDTTPTSGSTKMVTSGGVYTALAGKAASSHNHSASEITSGTLPVARGGTGQTSVDTTPTSGSSKMVTSGGVYTALSGKAASSHNHSASNITSGTLAVARGGTGVTSLDALKTSLGVGSWVQLATYTGRFNYGTSVTLIAAGALNYDLYDEFRVHYDVDASFRSNSDNSAEDSLECGAKLTGLPAYNNGTIVSLSNSYGAGSATTRQQSGLIIIRLFSETIVKGGAQYGSQTPQSRTTEYISKSSYMYPLGVKVTSITSNTNSTAIALQYTTTNQYGVACYYDSSKTYANMTCTVYGKKRTW